MYKSFLYICIAVLSLVAETASADTKWQPTSAPLTTPWGEKVTPENAWQAYPRPQMGRGQWLNLNGLWDLAIADRTASRPTVYPHKILVPYAVESSLSGVGKSFLPSQRLWYRRQVSLPPDWANQRILLHFGAVDYVCTLWINGALVGSHTGGFDPFSFDITPYLQEGGQELVLAVTDPSSEGDQARGKQKLEPVKIWYTPVSGIWQTVWLEPVPVEMSIADVTIVPDIDAGEIEVTVRGQFEAAYEPFVVQAIAKDGAAVVAKQVGWLNVPFRLPVADAKLWSPDSPHLYDLEVRLVRKTLAGDQEKQIKDTFRRQQRNVQAEDVVIDKVDTYFAMRKISLGKGPRGATLLLNNQPLFQYGPLDQGYWPESLLTPPSPEAYKFEIDYLKASGFNMLRKHIKVEPATYYRYCDEVGILVWQDMPSGLVDGGNLHGSPQFIKRGHTPDRVRSRESGAQFELELRRMIDALEDFPSIVMWVPFNEGWGQYDTSRVARWVQDYDPSRLANAISGWVDEPGAGNLVDAHVYRDDHPWPEPEANRAAVVGEFGGFGLVVDGHHWSDSENWGYRGFPNEDELFTAYANRLDDICALYKNKGLQAAVYTQTTDVEGEINGLMTYDRRVIKFPAERLAKLHACLFSAADIEGLDHP